MRRELARLESEIALCERCYGSETRLPARFCRPRHPRRVLLLAERPPREILSSGTRLGPDNEDRATVFLRALLAEAGIPLDAVVVGAASLCRPVSREVEAVVPPSVCVRECAPWVRDLVAAIEPRLIVTLGGRALRGLRWAFRDRPEIRALRFPEDVGATVRAGGTWVHPLYHTTVRARVRRPEREQRLDWRAVGRLWQWIEGGERGSRPRGRLARSRSRT
jgi:uracil-DNA glycosylase